MAHLSHPSEELRVRHKSLESPAAPWGPLTLLSEVLSRPLAGGGGGVQSSPGRCHLPPYRAHQLPGASFSWATSSRSAPSLSSPWMKGRSMVTDVLIPQLGHYLPHAVFCINLEVGHGDKWRQPKHTPPPLSYGEVRRAGAQTHLREDGNSEKEAQPVSLVGIGSSVLHTSDPTESKGVPWVVSMGTSKLADQLGARERSNFILRTLE